MTVNTVLVTGANGFVGVSTVLHFVRQGWHVRASVRTPEKARALSQNRSLKEYYIQGAIESVVLEDQTSVAQWEGAIGNAQAVSLRRIYIMPTDEGDRLDRVHKRLVSPLFVAQAQMLIPLAAIPPGRRPRKNYKLRSRR